MNILVVDDDPRMLTTLTDIFGEFGHDVTAAASGEEALAVAGSARPECVLMDFRLPGMSGVEALEALRPLLPGVPMVLMTAYGFEVTPEALWERGVLAVLEKPLDLGAVLSFLDELGRTHTVLVVDDDPLFTQTLAAVLEASNYRVETAACPGQVWRHLDRSHVDLTVLDLKLGPYDGLEVFKSIRARQPCLPVVIVTGYPVECRAQVRAAGANCAYACLYKPFDAGELVATLDTITQRVSAAVLPGASPACAKEGVHGCSRAHPDS
jgi:DNA-binding response OmpR family regulator